MLLTLPEARIEIVPVPLKLTQARHAKTGAEPDAFKPLRNPAGVIAVAVSVPAIASALVAISIFPATVSDAFAIVTPLTAVVTKAVVAICVVFVPGAAVGAVGVPVSAGDDSGARVVSVGCLWSSRADFVAVPAAAVPSISGLVNPSPALCAACTKAVVAICVVFVPAGAVGAVSVPVIVSPVFLTYSV